MQSRSSEEQRRPGGRLPFMIEDATAPTCSPRKTFSFRFLVPTGFVLFLAWVIYLANTGQNDVFPMNLAVLPHTDKIGHVVLYGLLAWILGFGSRFRAVRLLGKKCDLGATLAAIFACTEELSQFLSPHRTPDLVDLACGFLGIWIARRLTQRRSANGRVKGSDRGLLQEERDRPNRSFPNRSR